MKNKKMTHEEAVDFLADNPHMKERNPYRQPSSKSNRVSYKSAVDYLSGKTSKLKRGE